VNVGGDGATEKIQEPVARVAAVMRGSPVTDGQLYWLRGAITVVDPAHRWLGRLTAW